MATPAGVPLGLNLGICPGNSDVLPLRLAAVKSDPELAAPLTWAPARVYPLAKPTALPMLTPKAAPPVAPSNAMTEPELDVVQGSLAVGISVLKATVLFVVSSAGVTTTRSPEGLFNGRYQPEFEAATGLLVTPIALAFLRRIAIEEAALTTALGTRYSDYAQRTRRLVPFVY